MTNQEKNTLFIKKTALELGFSYCGISKSVRLDDDALRLEKWLKNNYQGKMTYMENYFDMRVNPSLLVPGAKSVVSLMFNYFPEKKQDQNLPKISKYAYGNDYHDIIKKKLKEFLNRMNESIGKINARVFVDSAPVLERAWATKSGLGWIGKNGNLISKKSGSFFFLAEIISDLELISDDAIKDYCGTCTACIDACPTQAILDAKIIDGSKCISYFTIELREEIPNSFKNQMNDWVFGCDVCQDVCPWNRFSKFHTEEQFLIKENLINKRSNEWLEMTDDLFNELYKNSPLKRAKLKGIKRNVLFIKD
jgi:epoxyqueuosine reductase